MNNFIYGSCLTKDVADSSRADKHHVMLMAFLFFWGVKICKALILGEFFFSLSKYDYYLYYTSLRWSGAYTEKSTTVSIELKKKKN